MSPTKIQLHLSISNLTIYTIYIKDNSMKRSFYKLHSHFFAITNLGPRVQDDCSFSQITQRIRDSEGNIDYEDPPENVRASPDGDHPCQ